MASKANSSDVDPIEVLELWSRAPIQTWNYREEDPAVRHISTIDSDGVSLAAIQGLYRLLLEQQQSTALELEGKDAEIEALKLRLARLERLLKELLGER